MIDGTFIHDEMEDGIMSAVEEMELEFEESCRSRRGKLGMEQGFSDAGRLCAICKLAAIDAGSQGH